MLDEARFPREAVCGVLLERRTMKHRLVFLSLLCASAPALAEDVAQRVAVVPYQGAGAEPDFTARFAESLRAALVKRDWPVVDAAETERRQRAAAMCGEDTECLSTLGQRLDARWVLGFGVGRVGPGVMVSAVLVDGSAGVKVQSSSEQLPELPADPTALADRFVDALVKGLSPPSKLKPVAPAVVPPPPLVEKAPPPRPLRPWAIGTAVGAGALAITGGVLTVVAQQHYAGLSAVPPEARAAADAQQRALNTSADVVMGTAIAAGVAAVVLFILDARTAPAPTTEAAQ
ncbi:MAG: hypothetical protein AB1938_05400 [Myxococcota bacterium]